MPLIVQAPGIEDRIFQHLIGGGQSLGIGPNQFV